MNIQSPADAQAYYLEDLTKIEHEIIEKSAGADFLYRGEPEHYEDEPHCGKVSSTLYRPSPNEFDSEQFNLGNFQEGNVQEVRNYTHEHQKSGFEILTELQHYGGPTNLIDFTTDYNIALFFACDGSHDEDGRVILLEKSEATIEKYRIVTPQSPQNRVIAQKSVFAHPPSGFIDFKDISIICVPSGLKQWILMHLRKYHDISTQSIYNDIHGYIRQRAQRTSIGARGYHVLAVDAKERAAKSASTEERQDFLSLECNDLLYKAISSYTKTMQYSPYDPKIYVEQGQCYVETREYYLAIETFSKAIFLRPDYFDAYLHRADAYEKISAIDFAIAHYSKVRDLATSSNDARYYGHVISLLDGRYENAIKGWREAIELKPEFAADAFFWCGTKWMLLSEWCKAKSEFQAAREKGMGVPSEFCMYYKSVKDFEADYRVTVPDAVAAILQPR